MTGNTFISELDFYPGEEKSARRLVADNLTGALACARALGPGVKVVVRFELAHRDAERKLHQLTRRRRR